jgi:hypothetical protein
VGQAAQQFVAPVFVNDGLADDGAQARHSFPEPFRNAAAMER